LTEDRADELVELVAAGSTLGAAAEQLGVSARTVRGWRRRAWSSRPEDAPFVALERRLIGALAVRRDAPALPTWEEAAAALEAQFPEHWRLDQSA
jgi:transposase-like protein